MNENVKTHEEMTTFLNEAWLGLGDTRDLRLPDLFKTREEDIDHWGMTPLRVMNDSEYIGFACKVLLNVELLPMQCVIMQEMWNRSFPMYLASRGWGKSFLMAVYCLLKMVFTPPSSAGGAGVKIVICGAAFRQSKVIFEYMETIWNNSPRLRSVCKGHKQGPRRDVDRCTFTIGENTAIAIPIGTGEKIRGLRANIILADEFDSISPIIFETVIQGFASVTSNPVQNVKLEAKIKTLQELNLEYEPEDVEKSMGNQVILSGTAGYSFKNFAEYWRKYKQIINSCGQQHKLEEIYPEGLPDGFNWKDYCVIRIPCELVPKGFMDDTMLARAKATTHIGLYQMEYGACVSADTEIITNLGIKNITDVQIGDKVLTHKGRFRKVINKTFRKYNGYINNIDCYGYSRNILVTPEHPFWIEEDKFEESDNIESLHLADLKELSNKTSIDVRDYVSNFLEGNAFVYPTPSSLKIPKEALLNIDNDIPSDISMKTIANKHNVSLSSVYYIKSDKNPQKNSPPKEIKLNYDFGLCLGHYASEGSIGANGRATSFAMDDHTDLELDKMIDHDILFSNKELLKGFIIGMWNGGGHKNNNFACLQLTNKNLVYQVKLALSYFGINCSFLKVNKPKEGIIKGRLVNLSTPWKLNISGEDFVKFMDIFYNKKIDKNFRNNKVYNENHTCKYDIRNNNKKQYDDYVYNLEVEEDNSYSTPVATVHNCFTKDSNGFFKRSTIEKCIATEENIVREDWPMWCPNVFDAQTRGSPNKEYVYGIDPASEVDNFSITVLELYENHARVVYAWTTTRKDHIKRKKAGFTKENDFYAYCARKIRDLMIAFPPKRIGLDAQGGGIAVMEALHNKNNLKDNDVAIWPVIDEDKEAETDNEPGLHILELCQFARYNWLSEANHGMRKDLEDRFLLFPRFDPASLELAAADDFRREMEYKNKYPEQQLVLFDTLEDCVMEIEELKNELTTIILTKTGTGVNSRDRWDTPEIKTDTGRKGRLRKDRYSALLIANMIARQFRKEFTPLQYDAIGGYIEEVDPNSEGDFYINAPDWMKSTANNFYRPL